MYLSIRWFQTELLHFTYTPVHMPVFFTSIELRVHLSRQSYQRKNIFFEVSFCVYFDFKKQKSLLAEGRLTSRFKFYIFIEYEWSQQV